MNWEGLERLLGQTGGFWRGYWAKLGATGMNWAKLGVTGGL